MQNQVRNWQRNTLDAFKQKIVQNVPLKRLGQPGEVDALVACLVSDQASFITGTAIDSDGGGSAVV